MTRFKQQKKKENGPGCLLIGAHMEAGEAASIKRIAEGVNRVLSESLKNGPLLLLETCAGQGSTLGHTFEQLVGTDGDVLDILTCDNLDGKKKENDTQGKLL